MNVDGLRNALTWLEQNMRADSIRMPDLRLNIHSQDRDAVCRILTNFVFGALKICAKRELRLHTEMNEIETKLLISLIEKFRTLPQIERGIPTIVIESFSWDIFERILRPNLGPNVIHHEFDSQGAEFLYLYENGRNRVLVSFCKKPLVLQDLFTSDWAKYDCFVKFSAA